VIELFLSAIIYGILIGGVFALMSVGLTLSFGVMRVANSAQAAFAVLGTFVAYWSYKLFGIDPLLGVPIGTIILFVLGIISFKFIVRKTVGPPLASFLVTFAIALVIENLMVLLWKNEYRSISTWYSSLSIPLAFIPMPIPMVVAFIGSIVVIGALTLFLKLSRLGKAIRATSMDTKGAMLVGIDVERIYLLTFGVSTATAGIGGALLGLIYSFYPALQSTWIGFLYVIVIVGGMGSITGTLVSAMLIGIIQSLTQTVLSPVWAITIVYVILIVVLIFRPEGLMGRR
jgi:branched-chain amino acid transport system permease protein